MQGKGTYESPYIVETEEDLRNMTGGAGCYYRLGNDIDCGETEWTAASVDMYELDGFGHKIKNITVQNSSVFSITDTAQTTFRNVNFENITLSRTQTDSATTACFFDTGSRTGEGLVLENCRVNCSFLCDEVTGPFDGIVFSSQSSSGYTDLIISNTEIKIDCSYCMLPPYGIFGYFGLYNSSFDINCKIIESIGALIGSPYRVYTGKDPGGFLYITGKLEKSGVGSAKMLYLFGGNMYTTPYCDFVCYTTVYVGIETDTEIYFGNGFTSIDEGVNFLCDTQTAPNMNFDKLGTKGLSALRPTMLTTEDMKNPVVLSAYGIEIGSGWEIDEEYNNGYPYLSSLRKFVVLDSTPPLSQSVFSLSGQGLGTASFTALPKSVMKITFEAGTVVTVPSVFDEGFNSIDYVVDWGDGVSEENNSADKITHTYENEAEHTALIYTYLENIAYVSGFDGIKAVDFPFSLRKISKEAFYGNCFYSVDIPPTVEEIEDMALNHASDYVYPSVVPTVAVSKSCFIHSSIPWNLEFYPYEGNGVNYEELENLPKINGVELLGDKTDEDIGIHALTNIEIENLISS